MWPIKRMSMKRILVIVSLLVLGITAYAQEHTLSDSTRVDIGQPTTVKYYAEIVYTDMSAPVKKTIKIDFGEDSILGVRYPSFKDKKGNLKQFKTVVDALNFMSQRGWVLEAEYVDNIYIDEGSSFGSEKHFVISKTLSVDQNVQDALKQ